MSLLKDYYAILGVPPSADARTVKAAFRALVKKYHPDTMAVGRPRAEVRFREVNEAYKVLSVAHSRREYDKRRRAASDGRPTRDLNLDSGIVAEEFTDLEVDALAESARDYPE